MSIHYNELFTNTFSKLGYDVVDTSYDQQTKMNRWRNAPDFNRKLLTGKTSIPDIKQRLESNLQTTLELPDILVKRFFNTVRENFPNLDTSEPS